MSNISEIDKNFKIETKIDKADIRFYNVLSEPFSVDGIFHEGGKFRRMPENVARSVSESVFRLHSNTAGGRVRFKTNSPYVAISAKMENVVRMSHFALCGSSGFDMYINNEYKASFVPPFYSTTGYEAVKELNNGGDMKEVVINFPLYSDVIDLYIGLSESATLERAEPYTNELPVVYYGSSITQGGCASRPGNSYQGFISRAFNLDYINLGFSGSARAEDEMADYIASLPMSMFVYDYDFNAPTLEHLQATHEKMFKKIRASHPDIPVIFLSAPKYENTEVLEKRRKIVESTYNNAILAGDKNVYFIPGKDLLELCGNEGTVDTTHPTDLGFFSMAEVLKRLIEKII